MEKKPKKPENEDEGVERKARPRNIDPLDDEAQYFCFVPIFLSSHRPEMPRKKMRL